MYARRDRTPAEDERDRVILSPEYQTGYSEGWDAALRWAGIDPSTDKKEG